MTPPGTTAEFVSICEVGPRDGLQIAKTRMTTDDKVAWIKSLAAAGIPEIEVGSFVPPRVIPQLSDTPEIVARVLAEIPGLTVQALAPNLRGAQNAYNAGVHKIAWSLAGTGPSQSYGGGLRLEAVIAAVPLPGAAPAAGILLAIGLGRRRRRA